MGLPVSPGPVAGSRVGVHRSQPVRAGVNRVRLRLGHRRQNVTVLATARGAWADGPGCLCDGPGCSGDGPGCSGDGPGCSGDGPGCPGEGSGCPGEGPRRALPPGPRLRPDLDRGRGEPGGDHVLADRPGQVGRVRPGRQQPAVVGPRVRPGGRAGEPQHARHPDRAPVGGVRGQRPDRRPGHQPGRQRRRGEPARRARQLVHHQLGAGAKAAQPAARGGAQQPQRPGVPPRGRLRPGQDGEPELAAHAGDHTEHQRAEDSSGRHDPILPPQAWITPPTRPRSRSRRSPCCRRSAARSRPASARRAIRSYVAPVPTTSALVLVASTTAPAATTLSTTITLPGRVSPSAHAK